MDCASISAASFVSYLLFYTMYSKVEKKLVPSQLIEIMTFKQGANKFFVEMNKAISLAGLTTLSIAFFFGPELRYQLIVSALVQLQIHSVYSMY